MKLGLLLRYSGETGGPDIDLVLEAEKLGYESVWQGESYGIDSVSPIAWTLSRTSRIKAGTGIMQIPARTPACTAMTAMTLAAMSNGRFHLGLGPSGPQVVEGWHGVAYGKPLARMKEYVEILRKIFAREDALQHKSEHYEIPYTGPGATGLGKPLKTILKPNRDIRIYTAAIAPAGLRTAGEVADGVQPIFMSPEKADIITKPVLEGMALAARPQTLENFDITPFVKVAMGDDLDKCRDQLRPEVALYVGGMGAREKNFYNDYAKRLGYEDAAVEIQDAFLGGRRKDAMAAIPDKMIDELFLVGNADRITGRLKEWKAAAKGNKVGTMLLSGANREILRLAAEAVA
ncbi:MAG: LLM class F420-dependent oxidoreductase [Hyphomicrobiaceae bacterium]|nr:LLM class F420-dependent oxidoreductase [Hyphomicrobiaceae bacterium]